MKYIYTIEQLKEAVKNSLSLSETCRQLGVKPVGGNFKTILLKIKQNNIDISHFTGKAWNVGTRFRKIVKEYKLEHILIKDSPYKTPSKLKKRLINEGLKKQECEICKNTMWLDQEIKLEIHHINGINTDNRLENLQILCPNCHSFTDNFRGKNIKKSALSEKRDVEYRKFRETPAEMRGNPEPSSSNREGAETLHGKPKSKKVIEHVCLNCKQKFTGRKQKYCSVPCYRDSNSKNRPSVIELIEVFKMNNYNFSKVGIYYNVSDNAVRKWCQLYKILDMVKRKSSAQTDE
jgi:5-methylcytosine-specific restriction endonuclease McrA